MGMVISIYLLWLVNGTQKFCLSGNFEVKESELKESELKESEVKERGSEINTIF
jgi:hypothetical protein